MQYHVILGEKLLPTDLRSGIHKNSMLGLSYWLMFYQNSTQVRMVDCSSIDKPLSVLYTFSVYWLWLSNSHQAIHAKGVEGHHLSPFLLLCRSLSMIFLWMENSLRRRMACWLGFHRSSRYGRIVAQPIPRPYKRYWWLPVCWTLFHRFLCLLNQTNE